MMVLWHRRGVKHAKFNKDVIAEAVRKVQNRDMTIRAASEHYQIPKSTLGDHVKGTVGSNQKGRKTALPEYIEMQLVMWVKKMARFGYGQTGESL